MIIRRMLDSDRDKLYEIWKKYYEDDFAFPNFEKHFISSFVIEDNNQIVTAGVVRLIAESVLITNKDVGKLTRRNALLIALDASLSACKVMNFDQLHAFNIHDESWKHILGKYKFRPMVGDQLVIDVEN